MFSILLYEVRHQFGQAVPLSDSAGYVYDVDHPIITVEGVGLRFFAQHHATLKGIEKIDVAKDSVARNNETTDESVGVVHHKEPGLLLTQETDLSSNL